MNLEGTIAQRLGQAEIGVKHTLELLLSGNTIPFISRYRKEYTGGLDETVVEEIRDLYHQLKKFGERKASILESLEERSLLNSALLTAIEKASDLQELEDIYLPFKPKRRTRATIAKEKGLEPLATLIFKQFENDPESRAMKFLNKDVPDSAAAINGAKDIIAEWMNESVPARQTLRIQFRRQAVITSKLQKGKEEEAAKFRDYFSFSEPLFRIASHRFMAIMRGEKEGFLSISALPEEEIAIEKLERIFVKGQTESSTIVKAVVKDAYKRLMAPSMETETLSEAREKAEKAAVIIFSENLRQLLMGSPLGEKRVIGIDPGFRSGCKVVCIDENGKLLHNETIYPHAPQNQDKLAMAKLSQLIATYKIDAVAIGNGTAGRETEQLFQRMRFENPPLVFVVSESGASVYSASKVAREEFPNYDVTVRGAVSIGRRLQDPLAELVKIDPKSIGVGQYQHDVVENLLTEKLENVVLSCVNQVGVNLNTASKHLLAYVSGVGPALAANLVTYRDENGPFKSRNELLKVPRLGEKVFVQAAGFLRISQPLNPLDNSAVHPERYSLVQQMAKDAGFSVKELIGKKDLIQKIDPQKYLSDSIGLPTLKDILSELEKPGRDPRKEAKVLMFDPSVRKPEDLITGMILPGIITNITAFGAFVDVGVKQDGLVHVSQLADKFVSNPMEVVKLHQHVKIKVMEVDLSRKRIAFSMKGIN